MSFSRIASTFPAEPALGSMDAFMNDFSAPRLDDSVFDGSLLHMLTQQDANAALAAAPRAPSSDALLPSGAGTAWGALDLDMERVEDIFDDLRASCGMSPCDIYDDETEDADAATERHDVRVLESAFGGLGFVPAQDVAAVFMSDNDSDSDSDEEEEGGMDIDADAALAAALAVAAVSPRRSARVPKPRATADYDVPPGPVRNSMSSRRPEVRAAASPIRRTQTKQDTWFKRAPVPAAAVARAEQSGVTLPAESANVPQRFHYLFLLGCRLATGGGMVCNIHGCAHQTINCTNMTRHVLTHFRGEVGVPCGACPLVFAREDTCELHRKRMQCRRGDTPARRALIPVFNELAEVRAVREVMEKDERQFSRVNKQLRAMWVNFVKDGTT